MLLITSNQLSSIALFHIINASLSYLCNLVKFYCSSSYFSIYYFHLCYFIFLAYSYLYCSYCCFTYYIYLYFCTFALFRWLRIRFALWSFCRIYFSFLCYIITNLRDAYLGFFISRFLSIWHDHTSTTEFSEFCVHYSHFFKLHCVSLFSSN